eukprot:scaffold12.g8113.t1
MAALRGVWLCPALQAVARPGVPAARLPSTPVLFTLSYFASLLRLIANSRRELLRKLRGGEESLTAQQARLQARLEAARERLSLDVVLLRLREGRRRGRLDPKGAFLRAKERALEARLSLRALKDVQKQRLRELKDEKTQRLRQYYESAVRGGATAGALQARAAAAAAGARVATTAPPPPPAAAAGAPRAASAALAGLDERAAAAALGADGLLRALVVAGVGGACHLFLGVASATRVEGGEHMRAALARPAGQALLTVSNHVGSIDDPLITSALVPPAYLLRPGAVRWTLCATDRCFKSAALAPFFRAAKVLPVERGAGIGQFGMQVAASRLAAGDWVHIFPEGTRSRTGKMGPVRRGIGWLVASCERPPLVVPFVHSGMEHVVPKGAKLPRPWQEVRVLVGEPVPVDDLLAEARDRGWPEAQLQAAITRRVGQALYQLKAQLEGLPLEEVVPPEAAAALSLSDDRLLPLIEAEMESLQARCWFLCSSLHCRARVRACVRALGGRRPQTMPRPSQGCSSPGRAVGPAPPPRAQGGAWCDRWHRWSLPSLSQRLRTAVATRAGGGGGLPDAPAGDAAGGLPGPGASFAAWAAEHAALAERAAERGARLRAYLAAARELCDERCRRMHELLRAREPAPLPAPG